MFQSTPPRGGRPLIRNHWQRIRLFKIFREPFWRNLSAPPFFIDISCTISAGNHRDPPGIRWVRAVRGTIFTL